MSDDVYIKLREFLHRLPGGYPETESGVEIRILEKLFTPEEAEMELYLSQLPETVPVIAGRRGMDESKAARLLESMAKKGSIFRTRLAGEVYYMANMFVVGIYEFHVDTLDRDMAEMMEEYIPHLAEVQTSIPTKQLRVVPVGAAVDTTMSVAPYDRIRELVEGQEIAAVAQCICRKEKGLLDQDCERPQETCLTFGMAAEYYIENGIGRKITVEEALKILDMAEESALVPMPMNSRDIMNICCCCECCCGYLRMLGTDERPADQVQSSYRAQIDPGVCAACGTCIERCQIEAIEEGDDFMEVDPARCIGCGLCVTTCPEEAVSLVEKPGVEPPPANILEMKVRMSKERGLE